MILCLGRTVGIIQPETSVNSAKLDILETQLKALLMIVGSMDHAHRQLARAILEDPPEPIAPTGETALVRLIVKAPDATNANRATSDLLKKTRKDV